MQGKILRTALAASAVAWLTTTAQTTIDLQSQARNIDFRSALSTMPIRTGAALPGGCQTGELFLRLDGGTAPLFICVQTNVWSNILPTQGGQTNRFLSTTGTSSTWRGITAGPSGSLNVAQTSSDSEVDIESALVPTKSGTNVWTGLNVYTPTSVQAIAITTATIQCNGNFVQVSPGGNHVLASEPTIINGSNGQICLISNVSASNTLTLQDTGALPGSNLRLASSSVTLAPFSSLLLVFNATVAKWVEVARSSGSAGAHTHAATDISSGTLPLARGGTAQGSWTAGRCVQVNAGGTALESAAAACGTGGGGGGAGFDRAIVAARCQNTIAAAAFSLDSGNAPAATCQFGTNTPSYGTLDWDDSGTKSAYDFTLLPTGSLPTIKVDFGWSTSATTGSVTWQIATVCVSGSVDPPYGTNQDVTAVASATANNVTVANLANLSLAGCSAGQQMLFRIRRDTADSLSATARLHFVRFYQ